MIEVAREIFEKLVAQKEDIFSKFSGNKECKRRM